MRGKNGQQGRQMGEQRQSGPMLISLLHFFFLVSILYWSKQFLVVFSTRGAKTANKVARQRGEQRQSGPMLTSHASFFSFWFLFYIGPNSSLSFLS